MAAGEVAGIGELEVHRLHKDKRQQGISRRWWNRTDQLQALKASKLLSTKVVGGGATGSGLQPSKRGANLRRVDAMGRQIGIQQVTLPQMPQNRGGIDAIRGSHGTGVKERVSSKSGREGPG